MKLAPNQFLSGFKAHQQVPEITDLHSTNWTDLSGEVTASGGTASKTDPFTTSNRFYRIKILP